MRVKVTKLRELQPATAGGAVIHENTDLTRPIHVPIIGELRSLAQKGRKWTTEPAASIEDALLRRPARLIVEGKLCSTPIVSAHKEGDARTGRVWWKISTVNSQYRLELLSPPPIPPG